ncbi:MAG: OB-fold nucleic acid binding domain-containing protein, partial [Candidatus Microsaccharimonas sp.]
AEMTPDMDGRVMTIGGIIASVRSIVTKSGSKMAFVKLEDKTHETELIIFPKLYEIIGAKLVQDTVVRASGKASARDRDGNVTSDVKLIADEIQIVDDEELRQYDPTGKKMAKPKAGQVSTRRTYAKAPVSTAEIARTTGNAAPAAPLEENLKKVFVHVKNPDDQASLVEIKQICSLFPGLCDIVLVLGPEKQSAIKMPFRVDGSDDLVGRLVKVLGEDAVVLK